MDKQGVLYNLRELFAELRKSDYSKDQSIDYIYYLFQEIIDKPCELQNEKILARLQRAKQNDFRFASGFLGRWAEAVSQKSKKVEED